MSIVGSKEPFYFGPLAGYGPKELEGLETGKEFKWLDKLPSDSNNVLSVKIENIPSGPPTKVREAPPPRPEVDQGKGQCQEGRSSTKYPDEIPTWDEFTQTTTFHGVRYIFDKTPFKIRRYAYVSFLFSDFSVQSHTCMKI